MGAYYTGGREGGLNVRCIRMRWYPDLVLIMRPAVGILFLAFKGIAPLSGSLVLYLDGERRLEAARSAVPGQLRAWLARLDADMDDGIELDDGWVAAPGVAERSRFVLGRLLAALAAGETDFAHSLLIYLATRRPELAAVRVRGTAGGWTAELEFT